jgi:hypothetical protein
LDFLAEGYVVVVFLVVADVFEERVHGAVARCAHSRCETLLFLAFLVEDVLVQEAALREVRDKDFV